VYSIDSARVDYFKQRKEQLKCGKVYESFADNVSVVSRNDKVLKKEIGNHKVSKKTK